MISIWFVILQAAMLQRFMFRAQIWLIRLLVRLGYVDTAVITLQMENGAIAVIDNCRRASYGYDQRAEVFGSDGMAAISNDSQSSTVISNAEGVTGEKPMFFFLERYMDAYGKEVAAFIDAIVNDKETPLNVYDGLKPVLMGLAAKKSSEEHRTG